MIVTLLELAQRATGDDESVFNELDSGGRTAAVLAVLTGQTDLMEWNLVRDAGVSFAYKSGARMRAIARRRTPFVNHHHDMVECGFRRNVSSVAAKWHPGVPTKDRSSKRKRPSCLLKKKEEETVPHHALKSTGRNHSKWQNNLRRNARVLRTHA